MPLPAGFLFHLDAKDADKNPVKPTYRGELDGRDQPLPGGDAVLVLTRFGENMIESTLTRQGKVVDRWRRFPDRGAATKSAEAQ